MDTSCHYHFVAAVKGYNLLIPIFTVHSVQAKRHKFACTLLQKHYSWPHDATITQIILFTIIDFERLINEEIWSTLYIIVIWTYVKAYAFALI
jgi:hypothetical protein